MPCHVFVSFDAASKASCDAARGLRGLSAVDAACFNENRLAELRQTNPRATLADLGPVCELAQIAAAQYQVGTCAKLSSSAGWCYVLGSESGSTCDQRMDFTPSGTPVSGAQVTVQCDK